MDNIGVSRTPTGSTPLSPLPSPKLKTIKNAVEKILAELAMAGSSSWEHLDHVATRHGIDNLAALITSHVGDKVLTQDAHHNSRKQAVIDTVLCSEELPKTELVELLQLMEYLDPKNTDILPIWQRHMTSLGLPEATQTAWLQILHHPSCPNICKIYLPLLRDPRLFEIPTTPNEGIVLLLSALCQNPGISEPIIPIVTQRETLKGLSNNVRLSWIKQCTEKPELYEHFSHLLPKCSLDQLQDAYARATACVEDPELQHFICIQILSKQLPHQDWGLHLNDLSAEKRSGLFTAFAKHPHILSKTLIGNIASVCYFPLAPEAISKGFSLSGLNPEQNNKIFHALFPKKITPFIALAKLHVLSKFTPTMIAELAGAEESQIPLIFVKLTSQPVDVLDLDASRLFIESLSSDDRLKYVTQTFQATYDDIPKAAQRFRELLCTATLSKTECAHLIDFHMSRLGIPSASIERWKTRFSMFILSGEKPFFPTEKDIIAEKISMFYQDLHLLLPLAQDADFFLSNSPENPWAPLSLVLHNLDISSHARKRCYDALTLKHISSDPAPILIASHLRDLTPQELSKLPFDASDDELYVAIVLSILQKTSDNPSNPSVERHGILIKTLPKPILVKLHTALMSHPMASSVVFKNIMQLTSVCLRVEGMSPNTWEPLATHSLRQLSQPVTKTSLVQSLEVAISSIDTSKIEKKPISWITELAAQGWTPLKVLGRTHIFQRPDGICMALKWQKANEDAYELFKEAATLQVLHKQKENLGLLSNYPTPVGVYEFEGDLPADYFAKTPVDIEATKPGGRQIAYCYICDSSDYFSYLHDPLESQSQTRIIEKYALARHALTCDLFTLAKNGLIMSQMADIFHRSEPSRDSRDDGGRFMAMNFLVRNYIVDALHGPGSGRLHHIERAVQYVNAGYSGLRDVGDSILLEDFTRPGFKFSERYFSQIIKDHPQEALTCILANFLSEYLLVYELTITERLVNQAGNALDWQDPHKIRSLAHELKTGFSQAMRYYCGISETLANRFVEHASIDWERAAKQLHFWSRKDEKGYLPFNTEDSFPEEIYGPEVPVTEPDWSAGGLSGEETPLPLGSLTRHRGTFSGTDPIKEPERGRVIVVQQMLMLDDARKKAEALYFEAQRYLKDPSPENLTKALTLYQESREYWPFDKRVYEGLQHVYTLQGLEAKAHESKCEKAALIIQNAWESHLRRGLQKTKIVDRASSGTESKSHEA